MLAGFETTLVFLTRIGQNFIESTGEKLQITSALNH